MPTSSQLREILRSGPSQWNAWRASNPGAVLDLAGANLSGMDLDHADLRCANLRGIQFADSKAHDSDFSGSDCTGAVFTNSIVKKCDFSGAQAERACFRHAQIEGCFFRGTQLKWSSFKAAQLRTCSFAGADLRTAACGGCSMVRCSLKDADLSRADLRRAVLCDVRLEGANLSQAKVFGVSAWRLRLDSDTQMRDLLITADGEPEITVDDISVAHFVDLLLHSSSLRSVLSTVTSKAILVLGRFSDSGLGRISVLRNELRLLGYVPIVFDFEPLSNRTLSETVRALAHIARFIIVDITDAKCVPQELASIVPHLPSVPVLGILQTASSEWSMLESIQAYPWFTGVLRFADDEELADVMQGAIADGPEAWIAQRTSRGGGR